jgi:antitoxin MazE
MNAKITKWGNSLGIRIPQLLAKQIELNEGDEIEISQEGCKLIITPKAKEYTLEQLLKGMSEEHLHSEINWGEPVGREQW